MSDELPLCHYKGAVLSKGMTRKSTTCRLCRAALPARTTVWRVLVENYRISGILRGNRYCLTHFQGGKRFS